MSKIINRPHLVFLLSTPIIILIGFFIRTEMLNINVLDTYFVFSKTDLTFMIVILFMVIGSSYWLMIKSNRRLSRLLSLIHIALTFGGILLIIFLSQLFRASKMEYDFNNALSSAISLIALITIIGQIVFPMNMIYGLIKNKTSG